jgi:hypothetical protein
MTVMNSLAASAPRTIQKLCGSERNAIDCQTSRHGPMVISSNNTSIPTAFDMISILVGCGGTDLVNLLHEQPLLRPGYGSPGAKSPRTPRRKWQRPCGSNGWIRRLKQKPMYATAETGGVGCTAGTCGKRAWMMWRKWKYSFCREGVWILSRKSKGLGVRRDYRSTASMMRPQGRPKAVAGGICTRGCPGFCGENACGGGYTGRNPRCETGILRRRSR